MKKKQIWIILTVILAMLLTACGSNGAKSMETEDVYTQYAAGTDGAEAEMFAAQSMAVTEESKMDFLADDAALEEPKEKAPGEAGEQQEDFSEKIIYTGNVYIETTEFDKALAAVDQAVSRFGGFVQDSNVSGHSSGDRTAVVDRYAYFVLRIPAERFEEFMSAAGEIGNVTSSGKSAQNVTSQYTDYEARLKSLYLQEERLLEMLGKATDLDSLITLEARLSEVRYEIERIERDLRNLDQRLAYSTVTLDLQEVEAYTQTIPVKRSFGQKISNAFTGGWEDFAEGMEDFAVGIVEVLPALLLWAVIIVVVIVVVRRKVKKYKAKKHAIPEKPEE